MFAVDPVLQCARSMPDPEQRAEIGQQIKTSYRAAQHETDTMHIRMLMADARQHISTLQGAVTRHSAVGSDTAGTWLDIKDPQDVRGRVGTGFPWERT